MYLCNLSFTETDVLLFQASENLRRLESADDEVGDDLDESALGLTERQETRLLMGREIHQASSLNRITHFIFLLLSIKLDLELFFRFWKLDQILQRKFPLQSSVLVTSGTTQISHQRSLCRKQTTSSGNDRRSSCRTLCCLLTVQHALTSGREEPVLAGFFLFWRHWLTEKTS